MKFAQLMTSALLASLTLGACSDQSGRTSEAARDIWRGMADALDDAAVAWDGLRELSAAQKDIFLERAEVQLERLDIELAELRKEAAAKGSELAEASRVKLKELEAKRREMEPQLEQLRRAGDAAFTEMRDGFLSALDAFRETAAEPLPPQEKR